MQPTLPAQRNVAASALLALALALSMPGVALCELGAHPQVLSSRVECFFRPARPGDLVVVTIKARRPGGLQKLTGFFDRSQYLRGDGKNEQMIGLAFMPTGAPDEFRAEFTVPATRESHPDQPLPEGPYRLELNGGVDGEGSAYYTHYLPAGSLAFDPAPGARWLARVDQRYLHGPTPLAPGLTIAARGDDPIEVAYEGALTDYCGKPVGDKISGKVTLPGKGQPVAVPLTLAVDGRSDQYRLRLRFRDDAGEHEQELLRCFYTDVTGGAQRELRLDDSTWDYRPAPDAKEAPTDVAADAWQRGRTFPGRSLEAHLGKGIQGVWIRTRFDAPDWLTGKRYELYFSDIRYGCRVYLNGQFLGEHIGPLYPFTIDATKAMRPGQANVLEVCVMDERIGQTPREPADYRFAGRFYWPIPAAGYDGIGVIGEVRVRALPGVSIADVFAMPRVAEGAMATRVELRNATAAEQTVAIVAQVEDIEAVALQLPKQTVTLAAGETRTVELSQPWAQPRFWWPHDPHLYRLRTTLTGAGGEVLDEISTRFGYRELRVAGHNMELNGRLFKTRLRTMDGVPGDYEEALVNFRKRRDMVGAYGASTPYYIRQHLVPGQQGMLDAADETGIMLGAEGSLGSVVSNLDEQRTWDNYAVMLADYFRRDKNHPSVVIWSVENEILICTNCYPDLYDANQKNLLKLGRQLQGLDPTRPIEFNGDADIDGTWSTMNLHYPRRWFQRPDLPNSAFWLRYGEADLPSDQSYPFRVTWNTPKPILIEEDGIFVAANIVHDLASFGGEESYRAVHKDGPWGASPIDDRAHAMLVEGYRDAEVTIYGTAYGGTGGPHCDRAAIPIRSFVRERDTRFFSGETVARNINLHHDVLATEAISFVWRLTQGEDVLAQATLTNELKPSELKRLVIELPMPEVSQVTTIQLHSAVNRAGAEVFAESHEYTVYPRRPLRIADTLKLGVFDRAETTASALRKQGLTFYRFGTIEPGTDKAMADLNCLIVGANGFDLARMQHFNTSIVPFLDAGGTLLVLRQDDPAVFQENWIPVNRLRTDTKRHMTISWRRSLRHPALQGITDDLLRYWRGDHVVASGEFLKTPTSGWRPLIDSGGPGGLRWASVIEMRAGKGRILLCQMHLIDKLASEPAAQLILEGLLEYAATPAPRQQRTLALLADPNGPVAERVAAIGVKPDARQEASVILVDASLAPPAPNLREGQLVEAVFDSEPQQLREHLQQGGTVILHGLTPANLNRWRKLLPAETTLEEVNAIHAIKTGDHPLLDGISATEVWWSDVQPWEVKERGPVAVAYAVKAGNDATEMIAPGALVAVPVEGGLLLLDQLRWESKEVKNQRPGIYLALLLENLLAERPR